MGARTTFLLVVVVASAQVLADSAPTGGGKCRREAQAGRPRLLQWARALPSDVTPEERQRLWLEMAHGPCCCLVCPSPGSEVSYFEEQLFHRKLALHRDGQTQKKAERVREITRFLNGHADDVIRWSLLHKVEDKERKQRERAGFESKLASLDFKSDEGTNYLWEMAEGKELGDGLQPKEGLRFSTTPHDIAVAAVDWLLRQKPHHLTDHEWVYLELRGEGLTRQEASVELGYAQGWGSRFEARLRSRLEPPRQRAPRMRWASGGEVRRFWAVQYGSGPRMRPLPVSFESVSIHGHSQRNGEWIDVGPHGKAKSWGRPPRSEPERRREAYEMELATLRKIVRVSWFTSFTSGTYTRYTNPGEELAPKRPYILGDDYPVPSAHPDETAKVVNMSGENGDKMIQFGKWEVYAFECYPNGKREVWYSAKNGGPPVYARTSQRLVEKMKATH